MVEALYIDFQKEGYSKLPVIPPTACPDGTAIGGCCTDTPATKCVSDSQGIRCISDPNCPTCMDDDGLDTSIVGTSKDNAGYGANGGAAGNAKIAANNLNIGTISANGGGPDQKKGAGGNVKVYTDIYSLSGISASGSNGFIGFFTDSAYPSGLSANQIKLANRTGSGFFVLETNLTDPQYKTYQIEIKDTSTGEKAKDAGGYDYLQQGRINNKYLTAAIGWITKLKLKLGKDYALAIVASNESFFNMSRCGLDALCRNITIPFVKY